MIQFAIDASLEKSGGPADPFGSFLGSLGLCQKARDASAQAMLLVKVSQGTEIARLGERERKTAELGPNDDCTTD